MEANRFVDHYSTLGLRRNASAGEIRRAYRRLVLRYHPDRSPAEPNAPEVFQRITESYQVLSNADRRRAYDELLQAFREAPSASPPRSAPAPAPRASRVGLRLSYLSAQNPLDRRDAGRGAVAAAALFPFLAAQTSFASPGLGIWGDATWALSAALVAFFAWKLGDLLREPAQAVGELLSNVPEVGEGLAASLPFLSSALATWAVPHVLAPWLGPLPTLGIFAGVLGGSVAGWVAAGLGRAFAFAEPETARRNLGSLVGIVSATVIGGFIGFLTTAATSDVLAGGRFFSLWSCGGGAGALGGAMAAAVGARRAFDGVGQEP